MHEIDASLLDKAGDAADIGEHGERRFARDRKRHDLAAGLRHLLSHVAPFGGDQRLSPGADERLCNLDGRHFASPGIEARHDLKYGHHEWGLHFPLLPQKVISLLGWTTVNRNSWRSGRLLAAVALPIAEEEAKGLRSFGSRAFSPT